MEGYNISEDVVKISDECANAEVRKKLLEEELAELGGSCKKILRLSWTGFSMDKVAETMYVTDGYARKKKSECMGKIS